MRVAITGATGFVGTRLVQALQSQGHDVIAMVRNAAKAERVLPPGTEARTYDCYDLDSVTEALQGAEAVINLAGANLFAKRWSKRYMKEIRDSRVTATRTLVEAMGLLEDAPAVMISASAVGFYGPRDGEEVCREDELDAENFAPRDYLANVCRAWEAAARKAELLGTRVVRARFGVILGRGEGALAALELPFKLFVGGKVGSGKQVMSWVHVADAVQMLVWALETPSVSGPLNVTAPNPVTNREFSKAFGRALGRPAIVPTPGIGLRVILGKVASVVTTGQRVPPFKATELGFRFQHETVDAALAAEYAAAKAA